MKTLAIVSLFLTTSLSFGMGCCLPEPFVLSKGELKLENSVQKNAGVSIQVKEITSTTKEMQVGSVVRITGTIESDQPAKVTLYSGITYENNQGALDTLENSRFFYPTQLQEDFELEFKINEPGVFHVTAYPRNEDGSSNWDVSLFDIRAKAPVKK